MMKKSQASTVQDLHDFIWHVLWPATPRGSNSKYNLFTYAEEMVFKETLVDTDGKVLLPSKSSLRTVSKLQSSPKTSHNTVVKNPPSSHIWPPLQTLATGHWPDPELFPFPRCFINCLRLISSALKQPSMPGLLSRDKALTSLLCSTGLYILVTIMFFALF